jgi:hypothetical protein
MMGMITQIWLGRFIRCSKCALFDVESEQRTREREKEIALMGVHTKKYKQKPVISLKKR